MGKYFTSKDMDSLIFYQVPKILLIGEKYKNMNLNAVKVYIILIDRIKLSMINDWKDEEGRYYVRLGIEKGAELLGMAPSTFKRAKKELADMDLLDEVREGLNKSNKLFPKQLEYTDADVYTLNNEVDDLLAEEEENAQKIDEQRKAQIEPSQSNQRKGQNELTGKGQNEPSEDPRLIAQNEPTGIGQNDPSREVKLNQQEGSKSATINNNSTNNESSKNEPLYNNDLNNNNTNIVNNVNMLAEVSEQEYLDREEIAFKMIRKYMLDGLPKETGLKAFNEVKHKPGIKNFENYFKSVLDTIQLNINLSKNLPARGTERVEMGELHWLYRKEGESLNN